MPQIAILQDLVVVFGLALVVLPICLRLKLPTILGFLLTGVLVGPGAFGLVDQVHQVEILAEIGIVFLLFAIGIEFSLAELLHLGRLLVAGGGLQVLVTGGAFAGGAWLLLGAPGPAVLLGCVAALSSTAIALKVLGERGETPAPHGRIALGILIFQDLAVVPMILLVPFLAGQAAGAGALLLTLAKGVGIVAGVLVFARWVAPAVLERVIRTRSQELFLLVIVATCLGTAWLTAELGLSLGLGAFLAGLVISESEYGHHALGLVLPFRDTLTSLFFVSVGMLLDPADLLVHPGAILGLTGAVLIAKPAIVWGIARILGYPHRVGILAGVYLAQIGEFGLILLHAAEGVDILEAGEGSVLLATAVVTMGVSPLLISLASRLTDRAPGETAAGEEERDEPERRDHVIIVGYGVNGQNVVRALESVGMEYLVVELNPQTVRRLRDEGRPVLFGDATRPDVLRRADIETARVIVVSVPHAAGTRRIVAMAEHLAPSVHQIVRTRFVDEVTELQELGADEVIPEEFETSVALFRRVLHAYLVSRDRIDELVREVRGGTYRLLRDEEDRSLEGLRRLLDTTDFDVLRLREGSPLVGRTLAEAGIRERTGALVLALHRDRETTPSPSPDRALRADDLAIVIGPPGSLARTAALFRGEASSAAEESGPDA